MWRKLLWIFPLEKVFVEARGNFTLNQELLEQVKAKMQEYVDRGDPNLKTQYFYR